ncbi:MAG: substrate-binding domain-containing protein [Candidatus Kapaibacterium sp.]
MKKISITTALIALCSLLFASCETEPREGEEVKETMTSGEFTVYCDAAVYDFLDTTFAMYREEYPKVKLTTIEVDARQAMQMLLSGNTRVSIIARDYLPDEDSLMKVHEVDRHERFHILDDALVFYANPEFPLDTLNETQIKEILTNKDAKLKNYFKELKEEPRLVTLEYTSSVFANIKMMAAEGAAIQRTMKYFQTPDSVRNFVVDNPNTIGIGYLSQVVRDPALKMIRIGFTDSTGKYMYPETVHQANIIRGMYPWPVPYYAYLLRDLRDLPYWFGTFLAKESYVQRYFKDKGLVPAFAKIVLIPQD